MVLRCGSIICSYWSATWGRRQAVIRQRSRPARYQALGDFQEIRDIAKVAALKVMVVDEETHAPLIT